MIDLDLIRSFILIYGISVVRMIAACSIVPFMSRQILPGQLRNSILFALGIMTYPIVAPSLNQELVSPLVITALVVKEVVIGILMGFMAAKTFYVALGVGFFIDNQRGASMASVMDPASGEQTSPLGQFLGQATICLFYTSGGFLLFISVMLESYIVWPIADFYPQFNNLFPTFVLGIADDLMRTIVVFAAPIVITVFIAEFGLGLMNRFAPQLNVFSLSMPVKSLVAVVVLIFYLPFLLTYFGEDFAGGKDMLTILNMVSQ